ncbi:MAG: hypothetical protein QOE78_1053 [Alphaproteobacteria bacterium]|jgi:hypothetical protein|nr:hypothetical protein [Alphaproteobacteria bacterium]MEA2967792.1 hypothetical protein [Alphaproteobacteria bacterium]
MEHLIFMCPSTGREVDSGVESEIGTLLRIRQQNLRLLCPACGGWHQWAVRDAFLAKAALAKAASDVPSLDRHIA